MHRYASFMCLYDLVHSYDFGQVDLGMQKVISIYSAIYQEGFEL